MKRCWLMAADANLLVVSVSQTLNFGEFFGVLGCQIWK